MLAAQTNEELRSLLREEEFKFRYECGYNKPTDAMTLNDGKDMVKCIWFHSVLFRCHAALDQLRRGISDTLQFGHLIKSYPKEVWGLFAASSTFNVSAEYLCDEFSVKYSESGSNNRTKEEAVVFLWYDYINDCVERDDIGVGEILMFISGSPKLPACGFGSVPTIQFTDMNILPRASTCDISLTFSRNMHSLSADDFKEKMDYYILNSHGYGEV